MVAARTSTFTVAARGEREIVLTREFDAPRELVFKVMTDPALIPQWWGRRVDTAAVDTMDVRPGGKWRIVTRAHDGEFAFRGEFREISPPERIVQTFEFEGMPGHISVETLVLEDLGGGRTRLTGTSVFDSREDRDGMLQAGMEHGARDTYDRLEELLGSLKQKT